MGTGTLQTAYLNGQIIDASHINELTQALLGQFIGRDSAGAIIAGNNLGNEEYPWGDAWVTMLKAAQILNVKLANNFYSSVATDSATDGANALLPHPGKMIVRLTKNTLTSIDMITLPENGLWLIIINDRGDELTLNNKTGTVSPTQAQIDTGSGDNLVMAAGAVAIAFYEAGSTYWRIVGGGGGGGASQKKYALTNNQTLTNVTGLLFDSTKETSVDFTLEVERIGAATYRQIINCLAVYNGTAWSLAFGMYAGDDLIQSSITNVQEIVLSITAGGQVRYATGNLGSHVKSNLKITQTRIKA